MNKERLVAFTDAILAIIMTILVLDLDKPDTPSLIGIWNLRENYFAYTLSFFWIGGMWVNMTRKWKDVEKIDGKVLWWSLILLFFSSLIPYVTNYVGINFYNTFAQCFYSFVVILVTVSNIILNHYLGLCNKEDGDFYKKIRFYNKTLYIDLGVKLIGVLLAIYIYPPIAILFVILAAFLPSLVSKVFTNFKA